MPVKTLFAPWRMRWIREGGSMSGKGCVLCDLAAREPGEESGILERGTRAFTVLNRFPYTAGHLMVVPMRHVASPADLTPEEWADLHRLMGRGLRALERTYHPDGFNVGINVGRAAGAGIEDHCHLHVVPRWNGDHNFLTVLGEARVVPEDLSETRRRLMEGLAEEGELE